MNRVLSKRFVRELREKLFRYIALGLLVAAGMTLVVSLAAAADTIIIGSNNIDEDDFRKFGAADNEKAQEFYQLLITDELPNADLWEVDTPFSDDEE